MLQTFSFSKPLHKFRMTNYDASDDDAEFRKISWVAIEFCNSHESLNDSSNQRILESLRHFENIDAKINIVRRKF